MDLGALRGNSETFARRDPVTGQVSWHPDLGGKSPGSSPLREYPSNRPCPLCQLGAAHGHGASDGEMDRPLLVDGSHTVVVPNRWSIMGGGGVAELVITRRHVRHLGALGDDETEELCTRLVERVGEASASRPTAFGLINVGVGAGGTQAHLHAQVLGSANAPGQALAAIHTRQGIDIDIAAAYDHDLVVRRDPDSVTWVPYAPFGSAEVRIYGTLAAIPPALGHLARRFDTQVGRWAYNVLVHPFGDRVLVQWLPRGNPGQATTWMCDAVTVSVDPKALAERLRD